jgi:hypothetical protein
MSRSCDTIGWTDRGSQRKKIPDRANHSRGFLLEISVIEITWLPERLLAEQARQPSVRPGQREQPGQQLLRLEQRQRHRSMAWQRRSCSRSGEQRPCGRGERSRGGMASVQQPCSMAWLQSGSMAWLQPCSMAWLRRPGLVPGLLRRLPEQRSSSSSLQDGSDRLQPGWRTQKLPAVPAGSCNAL